MCRAGGGPVLGWLGSEAARKSGYKGDSGWCAAASGSDSRNGPTGRLHTVPAAAPHCSGIGAD